MSDEKLRTEASRWILTARDDLEAAMLLKQGGKFALACFHAQQAGEKAVKGWFYFRGLDPWGHSITKLLSDIPEAEATGPWHGALSELQSKAQRLDQFYIPTRYPNGVPDITPAQAYSQADAAQAIDFATAICLLVESVVPTKGEHDDPGQ